MDNIITLYTETVIDSCHNLNNYKGKCVNKHGHSWLIQIWIQGDDLQKDRVGILFDFGNIKSIQEYLDHKDLNTLKAFEEMNPTAENITLFILNQLKEINNQLAYRVRVYETAVRKETWCQRQTQKFNINYL